MRLLLIAFIFLHPAVALELKDFKMRAREHVEWHQVDHRSTSTKFNGLSNTINLWYERPYDFSFGLAFSPVISNIKTDDVNSPFGEEIKLYNLGLESKYFPKVLLDRIFVRSGLGYTILDPDAGDSLTGVNLYLGIGYEIAFEKIGLGLELAYRRAYLSRNTEMSVITPSVGVHFYEMF